MPEYINRNHLQMLFASYAVTRHYPFLSSDTDKSRQMGALMNAEQSSFRERFSHAYDDIFGIESGYHKPFLTYAEAAHFLQDKFYFVHDQTTKKVTDCTVGDLEQLITDFMGKTLPSLRKQQTDSIHHIQSTPLDLTPFTELYKKQQAKNAA
jgi:hypothetical protein